MLAMATPTAPSAPAVYVDLDAPLTPRERREMEVGIYAAALGVRFFTRDLLSLGRPYTVEYSLQPPRHPQQSPAPINELPELGFDLISLFKSDLIQVKRVFQACRSDLSMRMESLHNAPLTTRDATALDAMQPNDFLVGLNDDDLLLVPPGAYSRVRRRILRELNNALQQQQQQQQLNGDFHSSTVLKLKFVRLDRVIQADPSRSLGYGAVLKKLEDLEEHHRALAQQFDELRAVDWAIAKERLAIPSKLLQHFCGWVLETMEVCMEEAGYQIADQTRAWIAAEWALNASDDDEDDDDDDVEIVEDMPMEEPEVFEIDDDVEEEEIAAHKEREGEAHAGRVPSSSAAPVPHQQESTTMAAALTHEQRLLAVGARNVDCRWRDVLQPHEMKWLGSSHAVLTNFIQGLVDGFVSDGSWAPEMASRSRSIVETLVIAYAKKLRTTPTDNATVKREFLQHARMLRSNIANAGNKQLRADVLSGAVAVAALCEMTSAELAPEALQAERQRRQEQHTKEITLSEPTGPRLVKTKHGFKEVGPVAPAVLEGEGENASQSSVEGARTVLNGTAPLAAAEGGQVTTRDTKLTDEVTERLSAMEFERATEPDRKQDQPASARPPVQPTEPHPNTNRTAPPAPPQHARPPAQRPVPTVDTARYSTEDGRIFLRTLFDPAQEPVIETLHRLQHTILSTDILATMSTEMKVAGISMYRDVQPVQTHYGVQQRARVRLLCWRIEQFALNGRDATVAALSKLIGEVEECHRLFGGLLDELRYDLHFPQPRHELRVYRRAIDFLVRRGMTLPIYRDDTGFFVEAKMDRLILGVGRDSHEPAAKDRAAQEAAAFLSELVGLRAFRPPPTTRELHRDQQWRRDNRPRESNYSHADYRHVVHDLQNGVAENRNAPRGRDHHLHESTDRKRPLAHDEYTEYPPPARRRVEDERSTGGRQEPSTDDAPLFFADSKGEVKPAAHDPTAEENAEKMQVEAYQELVRALVKNIDDVKARLNFDWDPRVPEKKIVFSSRLSVIRKITRNPSTGLFRCELYGFDGNLNKMREHEYADRAAKEVMTNLEDWLCGIRGTWLQLGGIYARIMVRKQKQRGNQADDSLSAANETRKDRAVSNFVVDREKKRGALAWYVIVVQGLIAVRQVCLNQKMAKRAAGEDFRDLLIWINKTRDEPRNGQRPTPNSTTSSNNPRAGTTAQGPTASKPQATARPRGRPSNMVVCSDDSDDDDDGDDDHYDDGGYSDDEDWRPQPKQPNTEEGVNERGPYSDKSSRFRIETILSEQYPVESEEGGGDDAKLRAVLRSLFTPEDELCNEISGIRGALKYRGKFDKQVVPNVTASIRLDLLRGDMFDVYASVNDVVHFKGTATSKQEACDKAVDGLLEELNNMRGVWVQLVHFYHGKEMGNNSPLESFNALRLANIAPIETRTEPPPATTQNRMLEAKMATDVHCVMYVANKVVYRVNDYVEQDAHTIATCRTIQFIVDLIDKGLDPMPVDIQDDDFRPMTRADWTCKVSLQDFGNSYHREDFYADARWAIPNRVPSETHDFRLPQEATIQQINRIPIHEFEQLFSSSNARQHAFFFRIEATYENGKFVNHLAEYGNKNKYRTYVVELEVDGDPDVSIFIFPPGASVNSQTNLYWPKKIMPPELNQRKAVYGYAIRRRYAPVSASRW